MDDELTPSAQNLTVPYKGVALYYEDADTVEYVRRDVPAVYRRIDEYLTLILDMYALEDVVGFQIKGFRSAYLRDRDKLDGKLDFLSLVGFLERILTDFGQPLVDGLQRKAYDDARRLALEDRVELTDLPRAALAR